MIWLDVALKTTALASAVIATLRAGSRAAYLLEHDAIGIMEGPLIGGLPSPNNDTTTTTSTSTTAATTAYSAIFELSEAFRHCVRLSILPQAYENVQLRQPVATVVEPYPLFPKPYLAHRQPLIEEEETESDTQESLSEGSTRSSSSSSSVIPRIEAKKLKESSIWMRPYDATKSFITSIPSSVEYTAKCVMITPRVASYWAQKAWQWKRGDPVDESDSEEEEDDWDWNMSTEGQLRFNATIPKEDGTSKAKSRVAELVDFAPEAFSHLRNSIFGISEESYRKSLFGSGPFVSFQSNSKGAARVGGVFFFTRDGAYMIKTIKKEEAKTLLNMLPKYHKHMKRNARTSLLTRFCGMYGVRIHDEGSLDHGQLHTFVVMNAVFPAEGSRYIAERFDLKGSTVGREVSEEELQKKGSNAVLKDLDLAREVELVRSISKDKGPMAAREYGLNIGSRAKVALLSALREDVKLLVDCQVMDYSLLVGVVNMETYLHFDRSTRRALEQMNEAGRRLSKSRKIEERALWAIGAPLRLLSAPPVFIAKQGWLLAHRTLASIVTSPLPYYGSGKCGVDGGLLSVFHGQRNGERAVYYMGLIDFLQPWTTRKVLERQFKGLMGQDTSAISCVSPEEYAQRFLEFLDENLS